MSPPALAIENLCKTFGSIRAVDQLSLEVPPGQMAGFLGPNGAGKSTTLYMIPRLVRPTSGCIRIFGKDVWTDYREAIQEVGVMVEVPAFYEYLSAHHNLRLAANLRRGCRQNRVDGILQRVGLVERQHDKVRTYSQGMKQRLGIARALLGEPRLLILDEPTNGMDPEGTREILSFLREQVTKQGLTVFLSSHLLSEIEEYCDTVFVIHNGRLVASGKVQDILTPHEKVVRVSFREPPASLAALATAEQIVSVTCLGGNTYEFTLASGDSAWLNEYLLGGGCAISALAPKQKTLKEFFLSLTSAGVKPTQEHVLETPAKRN